MVESTNISTDSCYTNEFQGVTSTMAAIEAESSEDGHRNTPRENTFDYGAFLRRMRHPDCRPLVGSLRDFINQFHSFASRGAAPDQLVHIYREYCTRATHTILNHSVWQLATTEEREMVREGVEYLLTNQIYSTAFNPPSERECDDEVGRRLFIFDQWLLPSHLDISNSLLTEVTSQSDTNLFMEAKMAFKKVNEYTTPRDKLICLLNATRLVESIAREDGGTSANLVEPIEAGADQLGIGGAAGKAKHEPSADELMPVLIYVLVKSQMIHLQANLQYISRYRAPKMLTRSSAYSFTTLLAAASFIERMDHTVLVLDAPKYEEMVCGAEAAAICAYEAAKRESATSTSITSQQQGSHAKSAAMGSEIPREPLIPVELRQEATELFRTVKEGLKVGANKSMNLFERLLEEAEAKIKAVVQSDPSSPLPEAEMGAEERERALRAEEEEQLQLALALSLSEQTHREDAMLKVDPDFEDKGKDAIRSDDDTLIDSATSREQSTEVS